MKKLILASVTLSCAASIFAQGTVNFNNRQSGTSHVWGPSPTAPGLSIVGQAAAGDSQPGTANYAGAGMILIGTAGGLPAAAVMSQLLGAPGAGAAESSLLPASNPGATTFRTGTAAGGVAASTVTFANIPVDAAVASFEMVAWDNSSGLYSTWALASQAWTSGLIAAGKSLEFNVNSIGGVLNTPPVLFPGLVSFNLYMIPEPTTFALAGLTGAALLIFRRRK